jgi:hypothetical protein
LTRGVIDATRLLPQNECDHSRAGNRYGQIAGVIVVNARGDVDVSRL